MKVKIKVNKKRLILKPLFFTELLIFFNKKISFISGDTIH